MEAAGDLEFGILYVRQYTSFDIILYVRQYTSFDIISYVRQYTSIDIILYVRCFIFYLAEGPVG